MRVSRVGWPFAACLIVALGAVGLRGATQTPADAGQRQRPPLLRLHGLVEPVRSHAVTTPRLAAAQPGPGGGQLVIVRLVAAGTVVRTGDLLVEFDRHAQVKAARDREAEYRDFVAQIRLTGAEHRIARARRTTELVQADNAVALAELDLLGADLIAGIEAEKRVQALEEARAHLAALRRTQTLKDAMDAAELRTLEIQRDRARSAWQHAEQNAERMLIVAPLDGLVVLKTIWKAGTMAVVQEGEEVRPGIPILDVVDPSEMRVRALVNQADVGQLEVGQPASVTLDSYPARTFHGRLEHLSPVAAASSLNPRVRQFAALFSIDGSDPHLLPDLAAAIDTGRRPDTEGRR